MKIAPSQIVAVMLVLVITLLLLSVTGEKGNGATFHDVPTPHRAGEHHPLTLHRLLPLSWIPSPHPREEKSS